MSTTGTEAERKQLTQRARFTTELMKNCQTPQLHLALIVSLTGGVGFYVAYLMLESALDVPWLRYPLSVAIAYLTFLLMLSSWVKRRGGEEPPAASEETRAAVPASANAGTAESASSEPPVGFEDSLDRAMLLNEADANRAEAAAFVVVATMALLGAGWAAVSIVQEQPALSIDLLLAVLFPMGLYGRVREAGGRHWPETGMRLTLWPGVMAVLILALLGAVLHWYAPHAHSFGEVLRQLAATS